jgi:hypothetical protein
MSRARSCAEASSKSGLLAVTFAPSFTSTMARHPQVWLTRKSGVYVRPD